MKARRAHRRKGPGPGTLRTAAAVAKLIEATVNRYIAQEITPEQARILLYAAQTATSTVRALTLDSEIEGLKEAIAKLQDGQKK